MDVNITKQGIWNCSLQEHLFYDMEFKTLADNSVWMRVFMHNNKAKTVLFTSLAEILNSQTEDKYSRLYMLDYYKGNDGKYEFMICYPDNSTQYNRWKQTNNPCKEYVTPTSDGSGTAEGYEPIHIDSTTNFWGGLTRQNASETAIGLCYLSGSVGHSNWFYAIGATATHGAGIPMCGFSGAETGTSTSGRVELWIRVDTLQPLENASLNDTYLNANDFIEI